MNVPNHSKKILFGFLYSSKYNWINRRAFFDACPELINPFRSLRTRANGLRSWLITPSKETIRYTLARAFLPISVL